MQCESNPDDWPFLSASTPRRNLRQCVDAEGTASTHTATRSEHVEAADPVVPPAHHRGVAAVGARVAGVLRARAVGTVVEQCTAVAHLVTGGHVAEPVRRQVDERSGAHEREHGAGERRAVVEPQRRAAGGQRSRADAGTGRGHRTDRGVHLGFGELQLSDITVGQISLERVERGFSFLEDTINRFKVQAGFRLPLRY